MFAGGARLRREATAGNDRGDRARNTERHSGSGTTTQPDAELRSCRRSIRRKRRWQRSVRPDSTRKHLAAKDLVSLADLYTEAGQNDEVKVAVDRALATKDLAPPERAAILVYAIRVGLREPVSEARNVRLEKFVSELDTSTAATMDQKLDAHVQMNGWYRYDDVDAGIIKHSTWIIDAAKKAPPDQRRKFAQSAISAYVNLAQALAGQGQNDRALALLRSAATELADVQPPAAQRIDPEIARLQLVGTPGAAITAPRWLNMPEGKTELAMPGFVTLLEFSAHWCVPCKESYPGVNRLRQKYGKQGFRVVLATQYYGYFEQERTLAPQEEFEHDRKYFAEHGMDVPIAVGDRRNNCELQGGRHSADSPDR